MQYFVYIIGKNINELEPYETSYVGVTNDLKRRWNYHKKSKYTIGETIRKNNFSYENNMKVIFYGDDKTCYDLEKKLRPLPFLGLNESVGGSGGYTKYSKERNEKISKKLKGRTVSWGNKMSETKKKNKALVGASNPKAKKWKLIGPDGKEYFIDGNIQQSCKDLNILWSSLMYHKNKPVPKIVMKTNGGFRSKYPGHLEIRQNTTGWILKELKE